MAISKIRKAVFPVGGLGTRFLPATKAIPKEMLPVVDKPLIQYAVEEARAAGIEEFIFVTGRGKSAIEDHFDHSFELENLLEHRRDGDKLNALLATLPESGAVLFTRQQLPLGLGHAIWCARNLIGAEPFAVLLADDLIQADVGCLQQMMEAYEMVGGHMVAAMEIPPEQTQNYGILDPISSDGRLVKVGGLVEKPAPAEAPSNLSIIGRYILQPQVFDQLKRMERGAGGEIQITDAIAATLDEVPLHGYRFEGTRYDCGDKVGYLHANIAFALARPDLKDQVAEVLAGFGSGSAPSG